MRRKWEFDRKAGRSTRHLPILTGKHDTAQRLGNTASSYVTASFGHRDVLFSGRQRRHWQRLKLSVFVTVYCGKLSVVGWDGLVEGF
jgi:hypothetical protein